MKTGTRVVTKSTDAMIAWGIDNEPGVIIGQDPRGSNPDVVLVRLDKGPSILETKGVHVSNLYNREDQKND
jgi:hypothetical protein